ncbi:hypothetical protein [Caulobacter sp. 1776]|uniref:hypothetical protein n=1 Tax=Caulobacter sp. 1776 TaxID=3156420 RepID=UPI00339A5202
MTGPGATGSAKPDAIQTVLKDSLESLQAQVRVYDVTIEEAATRMASAFERRKRAREVITQVEAEIRRREQLRAAFVLHHDGIKIADIQADSFGFVGPRVGPLVVDRLS